MHGENDFTVSMRVNVARNRKLVSATLPITLGVRHALERAFLAAEHLETDDPDEALVSYQLLLSAVNEIRSAIQLPEVQ